MNNCVLDRFGQTRFRGGPCVKVLDFSKRNDVNQRSNRETARCCGSKILGKVRQQANATLARI